MKNILLINYNPSLLYGRNEILNILTISSLLEKNSLAYSIMEINSADNIPDKGVFNTLIITSREKTVIEYCQRLKDKWKNNVFILFFHEYWSFFAENPSNVFDAIIINNNFGAIYDIMVRDIPLELVNGIVIKQNGWNKKNNNQNVLDLTKIKNLPYYKYPGYGIYTETAFADSKNPDGKEAGLTYFARGCNGNCTFCINPLFYQKRINRRTLDSLIEDINFFIKKNINCISFEDDIFTYSLENLKIIYREFEKKKINIKYRAHAKLDQIDEEKAWLLKNTGCVRIDIGIESGSEKILKKIKKDIDISQFENKLNILETNNIKPYILFICGFPDETEEDLNKTQELILFLKDKKIKYGISFFRNIPGSEINRELNEKNEDYSDHRFNICSKNHSNIKDKDLFDFYYKNTGIKPENLKNSEYFLNNCIEIDIRDHIEGKFEPVPLNYWDEIKDIAHLVGRFNGFIEYCFKSRSEIIDLKIEFYACTQNTNNGKITVFINNNSLTQEISEKSQTGKKITLIFKNIKLDNNNKIKISTNDNNGITLFNKNITVTKIS